MNIENIQKENEPNLPKYKEEIIDEIRVWCEEGRKSRQERYTRSIVEYIAEICYLIVSQNSVNYAKLLEIQNKLEKLEEKIDN